MIIFYSNDINSGFLSLTSEDSLHCAKVLRHRVGDGIFVVDGCCTMYEATITDANPKKVCAKITATHPHWHSHPYHLTMAVCPTKNNDRFEWFVEKATEIGVDEIIPLVGEHSERKVYKAERAEKIALSATKQSLKAKLPLVGEMVGVKDFVKAGRAGGKFIAYCFEDSTLPRVSLFDALDEFLGGRPSLADGEACPEITVLIGPEGDFSADEARLAVENGYIPVHLGESRLRTETAAMVATAMVYSKLGV